MTIIPNHKYIDEQDFSYSSFDKLCKKILFSKLSKLQYGSLMIEVDQEVYTFGEFEENQPNAKIEIRDVSVFREVILGGEPAAGSTYVQGFWTSENVYEVMRLFILNRGVLFDIRFGLGNVAGYLQRFGYWLNRNTKKGSIENIHAHYDIGNDFYKLFLDERMMYSSAYFSSKEEELNVASENKLKLICEKLKLSQTDSVLEIGTGWGGFAVYAAENYGCSVTTTTISDEQYSHALSLVKEKNLTSKIKVIKKDYRELDGTYDKLVSIEMIESVGSEYLDEYFRVCNSLVHENGLILIQAITISDYLYSKYVRSVDFIRKYIFPGGSLPSLTSILNSTSEVTDLTLIHSECFASSYAKTLHLWNQSFINNKKNIIELGYPKTILRLWEYYLKYCKAGFDERIIDVQHLLFKKPYSKVEHTAVVNNYA